ncbi:MAG: cytochrome ubiquinol oxidase subunit I [Verrucomicrobiales bacterium]|nr:cytochrome ubiquinol oxidase subunit I [Verrucomicrobiota bacterium JB025]
MNIEILSRVQFAFTAAFHYLFPPLTIGLGVILVMIEGMWLKTGDRKYHNMARFWTKVFALIFGLGVATGIVLEFEFGTNWATYSRFVGDIFGSALAAEGIFAFFLESGFLAILLFGWDKVGPKLHFFATCMVAFGAHFSAVWIIVANSWQQTPAGSHLEVDGEVVGAGFKMLPEHLGSARMVIDEFWEVVFNPSTVERLSHTLMGAWLAGAFLVVSVSSYYLLKKRHHEFSRLSLRFGLALAIVASLCSLVTGHGSAKVVAEYQPSKLAAMEGHWESGPNAPLHLAGWVDEENGRTVGPSLPGGLSWLIAGTADHRVTGLSEIAEEDRPPVQATFQFFHLMVALGMGMIGYSLWGGWLWWRKRLSKLEHAETRWFLKLGVVAVLMPQLANQAGWFTAEIGRQPWIVWGYLRTSDGLSAVVKAEQVLASIIGFGLIYLLLFVMFVFLLNRKIQHGPEPMGGAIKEGR